MNRVLAFFFIALAGSLLLTSAGWADSFPLNSGETLNGEAMGPDTRGVLIKKTDGSFSERIPWTNFSQPALRVLAKKLPKAFVQKYVEPLLEDDEPVVTQPRAAAPELKFTPPARMERPDPRAGFGTMFQSPLMVFLFLLLYAANIYAGYEISLVRNYHSVMVCGIAAVAPVVGPVIFLCMPTQLHRSQEEVDKAAAEYAAAQPETILSLGTEAPAPAQQGTAPQKPAHPAPIVYQRGQTTFNRRFFETKLNGFMKVIPGEAEKDMVVYVKSARGEFIGTRISKILPNEFFLQVEKGDASSDVIIPYNDIFVVAVRHKDSV